MPAEPLDAVEVKRHTLDVRIAHWIVALCFILLGLSGLALFYPPFFFLTALFGGGETARLLHPWLGIVLVAGYLWLFVRFVSASVPAPEDMTWMLRLGDAMSGREENLPEIGKFNPGQKLYFWGMAILILVLLASGIIIWNAYFATATSIPTQRIGLLVHSIAAILAILGFIVHVHMVTWEPGTLRAMVRGSVTGGWGWKHHRKWLRGVVAGKRAKPGTSAPAE
ncbi:MAG: formate dehydrogenase subunit gamma [Rhodospirillales bacterium]|nr:formate dehydrogenase subunit gamma [Rhodospirillales bacterium]